jgi:glycosyltransferase involved in cell wall biosynthesis
MKVLGVVQAYNEEDCIYYAVKSLVDAGVYVHVFDHGSTDNTAKILLGMVRRNNERIRYHYIDRNEVPIKTPDDKQSPLLWNTIGAFVRSMASEYDWVIWQAADELIRQPDLSLITVDAMRTEAENGIQVIRPLIRNFVMTTVDGDESVNYLERMKHYAPQRTGHAPRAWQIDLTPEEVPIGTHMQDPACGKKRYAWYSYWPKGTRVSNNVWRLDHYRFRSLAQARKKADDRDWIGPNGYKPFSRLRRWNFKNLIQKPKTYKTDDVELPMP